MELGVLREGKEEFFYSDLDIGNIVTCVRQEIFVFITIKKCINHK